jgi:hypothetical protein
MQVVLGGVLLLGAPALAGPPKPEKIPVSVGKWTGPSAGTFKGAMKAGLNKECKVGAAKGARAIVEGVVEAKEKGFLVKVMVKAAKNGETVEEKEYSFSKAKVSSGQRDKMGREISKIVRKTPE